MRYHSNLIKHYISINDSAENIANKLILKTCEVEEIVERILPSDVVIGKVLSTTKHPQADKLMVCQIDCGSKGSYQICTGGENVTAGSYVPVAIPGCYLPKIDLKIEPRKLRGEDSNGMICSKEELGINEDTEQHWIWTLQYASGTDLSSVPQQPDFDDITDTDCGVAMKDKYPWLESYIFDVDNKTVTHRPDLTGHFGLGWELHAMYGEEAATKIIMNKLPSIIQSHTYTSVDELVAHATKHNISIQNTCDKVQVYSTILLENCSVKTSSFFTRVLLRDCNLVPKNNWVDFSNLTMVLTGQPIHCFDADKIDGQVTVRYATEGEQFTDLLDTVHTLTASDIVIADNEKILALGGVIGGKDSAVTANTKRILVEIAHFDSIAVRKTGTRLSLRTDAELRFEKHINPQFTAHMPQMVLDLLQYHKKDLGEFAIVGMSFMTNSVYSSEKKTIAIDRTKISNAIFGDASLASSQGEKILQGLGFTVAENTVTVPRRRSPDDINGMHDIIEEVIRIHGYENIAGKELYGKLAIPSIDKDIHTQQITESTLVDRFGYTQTETYPWIHEKYLPLFNQQTSDLYQLQNAPAPELQYLRNSMIYGLLDVITKNYKTQDTINIFDTGKIRWPINGEKKEIRTLGMLSYTSNVQTWQDDPWMHTKNAIEQTISSIVGPVNISYTLTDYGFFHKQKQCTIRANGVEVGYMGQLHPAIMEGLKLSPASYAVYTQIHLHTLETIPVTIQAAAYETLQDQILWRDLCFVIDQGSSYQTLWDAIKTVSEVKDVHIFDLYAGDKLQSGKKSCAFSIKLVGEGNTTTEQINNIMNKIIKVCEQTGATLR